MGNVCQAGDQSPCQSIISPKIKEALQGTQYGPLLLYFSHVSRNNKVKTVCCWVILSHAKVKLDAQIFYLFNAANKLTGLFRDNPKFYNIYFCFT